MAELLITKFKKGTLLILTQINH